MTPAGGKSVKYDLSFMLISHRSKLNLFINTIWGCIPNFIDIDVMVLDIVKCVGCSPSLYSYFQVKSHWA